ncbi:MAG: molybdopterin-dependent oxidoreductase [Haloplanus sp.]
MTGSEPPDLDPDRWTVTVAGTVDEPLTLRPADLSVLPSVRVETSTDCDGAPPVRRWSGVRVDTLLDRTSPHTDASHGLVHSADPEFACGFDLERLREAVLAVRVDGDPIPTERGGPVRLLPGEADCWERVKWVSRIDVLDEPPGDADTAREQVPADG